MLSAERRIGTEACHSAGETSLHKPKPARLQFVGAVRGAACSCALKTQLLKASELKHAIELTKPASWQQQRDAYKASYTSSSRSHTHTLVAQGPILLPVYTTSSRPHTHTLVALLLLSSMRFLAAATRCACSCCARSASVRICPQKKNLLIKKKPKKAA